MSRRAVAPVVGVSLLLAVVVVLAAVVGAFVVGLGGESENAPQAAITGECDGNEITLTHAGGDDLDVNELAVRIFVDGRPLEKQPAVPATGMPGFRGAPGGAFNSQSDNTWTAGETASVKIAATTNSPQPSTGSRVTVRFYMDGEPVSTARV